MKAITLALNIKTLKLVVFRFNTRPLKKINCLSSHSYPNLLQKNKKNHKYFYREMNLN